MGEYIIDMMELCWDEAPDTRPTFQQIRRILRRKAGGEYVSIALLYIIRICMYDEDE